MACGGLRVGIAVACWAFALAVLAQPAARVPQPEDILPLSDFDDPIGIDSQSRALDSSPAQSKPESTSAAENSVERARYGPEPPPLLVRAGEVLTASPATRELSHRVSIELEPGRARVRVTMYFESASRTPSELKYRLALPADSLIIALTVCNAHGCREAQPQPKTAPRSYDAALLARGAADKPVLPIARLTRDRTELGDAVVVHAAPVASDAALTISLSYESPASVHAGVVRFSLPARGMDPQLAPAEVSLTTKGGLIDPRLGPGGELSAPVRIDPWIELAMRARVPDRQPVRASLDQRACAAERCSRARLVAGPRTNTPVDMVIALDVSPSTEGPARGRLVPTLAALLAAAPPGSRVRALAFASRASVLLDRATAPDQVALAPFAQAIADAELGSATRFEAAWELARAWFSPKARAAGLRALLVIVGDGGMTRGQAGPFERARAAGVQIVVLNASDMPSLAALREGVARTSGIVIELGPEADAAARGRDPAPLEERVSAAFAPNLATRVILEREVGASELGPLRAGEGLLWRGMTRGPIALRYQGPNGQGRVRSAGLEMGWALWPASQGELVALDPRDLLNPARAGDWPQASGQLHKPRCDRRGPAARTSGISSDARPVALAEERGCGPAEAKAPISQSAQEGTGMPSDPLLSMLRQRILPIARGCFRRDRRGQLRYEKRAVFVFSLAEREVVDAHVEGVIPEALRTCLLTAVDQLDVPRFSGVVKVRYPLITESIPAPEQVDLTASTSGALDRLFGDTPSQAPGSLDAGGSALHNPPASRIEQKRD
jgi:hypothetical protein